MEKLDPLYKAAPLILIIYGVVATYANMSDLRISGNNMFAVGASSYEERMLYISAVIRGFYEFFFFLGLAALVAGLNKRNSKGAA